MVNSSHDTAHEPFVESVGAVRAHVFARVYARARVCACAFVSLNLNTKLRNMDCVRTPLTFGTIDTVSMGAVKTTGFKREFSRRL